MWMLSGGYQGASRLFLYSTESWRIFQGLTLRELNQDAALGTVMVTGIPFSYKFVYVNNCYVQLVLDNGHNDH